jgi:hypothetical protein
MKLRPWSPKFGFAGGLLLAWFAACSPASTGDGGSGGNSGSGGSGSGGNPGSGGSQAQGGSSASGGSTSSGGSSGGSSGDSGGAGGTSSTGGSSGSGSGGTGGDQSGGSSGSDSGAGGSSSTGGTGGNANPTPDGGAGGGGGGSKEALFLGSGKDAIDASLMTGLKAKGFTVTVAPDTAPATMAMGKGIVIISASTSRANLKSTFKEVAVPIIIMKDGAMQMLGMTGGDIVTAPGGKSIAITMADSPLAAGKTGTIAVYSNTDRLFAGTALGPDAIKVATLTGQAMQWAIFAYPSGGMMVGSKAPAKRVGFFAHQDGTLSPDGLALFEAAIDWATTP